MRHALTQDHKLNELGVNLDYWRWKYKSCYQFHHAEFYQKYQEARKAFGEYYKTHYNIKVPELNPPMGYTRLADLTEVFEEYGDY